MAAAAPPPPAERDVDVGGSVVHLRDMGAGPPVLLLHGSGPGTTGWGAWRALAVALAGRHRVVIPDQAGFGVTPPPSSPLERRAPELLELLYDDAALVTDEAVRARSSAMEAGAAGFAPLFPPPRERWIQDLTLTREELAAVRSPVLLVHGARDRLTPMEQAALPLLEQLPDARLHAFGRCGHVPAVERPAAFTRLVADFLGADASLDDRPPA